MQFIDSKTPEVWRYIIIRITLRYECTSKYGSEPGQLTKGDARAVSS